MSTNRKTTAGEELERIEDALVESLLNATEAELREEIAAAGGDPETSIAEVDRVIASAVESCMRSRMEKAHAELVAWREKNKAAGSDKSEGVRARFERLLGGNREFDSKMTLAARKGEGLSERDLEALLEDIAELERLEKEKGDG